MVNLKQAYSFSIDVIIGIISSIHSFNSQVGKGSNSHDLVANSLMVVTTSATSTLANL